MKKMKKNSKMKTTYRGRTKEGKKMLTLYFTEEEIERLEKLAEANLRSRSAQATWAVLQAISTFETPNNVPSKENSGRTILGVLQPESVDYDDDIKTVLMSQQMRELERNARVPLVGNVPEDMREEFEKNSR